MANLIAPQQVSTNSRVELSAKQAGKVAPGKGETPASAKEFESKLEQGISASKADDVQLTGNSKQVSAEQAKQLLADQSKQISSEQAKRALAEQAKQEALKKTVIQGTQVPVAQQIMVSDKLGHAESDQKAELFKKQEAVLKATVKGDAEAVEPQTKTQTPSQQKFASMTELQPQVQAQNMPQAQGSVTRMSAPELQQLQAQMAASANAAAGSSDFGSDVEIEGVNVKSGSHALAAMDASAADSSSETAKRVPTSKMSTSDYLNFRDMVRNQANPQPGQHNLDLGTNVRDPRKDKLELINGQNATAAGAAHQMFNLNHHQARVVEAPVTQGSQGKTVLSHDAVHQITQQVNLMNSAKQDGEIKIRLRPDHLGELQMVVRTSGSQVAVQIRAHDHESKKIIEDSLGSLKDSLSKQNLSLAHVEVVNQPQASAHNDQMMQMDLSQFRQNSGQEQNLYNQGQDARQERLYEESLAPVNLSAGRTNRAPVRSSNSQGLDLIA